ncbi:hypothetical protein Pint_35943 [Pistacia integerrima]|uniref:Uncharacterized protein n=1 Tax=Pistacia integerrima TaxID=434235 RepID=A0ACC0Y5I4_9ROSI|nr:hypothetical protein Pint_35943 [Pistacia integerrima]
MFLQDPWWNPAVEEQVVMHIHRIGQTKRVMINRFIVKGTVEERMEAVQALKQWMISGSVECGFYIIRYIRDIVENRLAVPKNNAIFFFF